MNKNLASVLGVTTILVLTLIVVIVYDNHLNELEDLRQPNIMGSYFFKWGYFNIDPATILLSMENGGANVFTPLSEEDALDREALTDLPIYWMQSDFLKIASALGQYVWDDPMDLKEWSVYTIDFTGSCGDPIGFDSAGITYFKTEGITYVTRLIEIEPYFGWARWGDEGIYPQPILQKWHGVELLRAKITADDALRIVNEDVMARFQIIDNVCGVTVDSSLDYPKNWDLKILRGSLDMIYYTANFDTGEYTFHE